MDSRILFRVEGNDIVGHGHFMRCLTIARYLHQDFDCVFAISTASDWVTSQLNEYNFPLIPLTPLEQFHPDDSRSSESWTSDIDEILRPNDIMILDGYRFDSSFYEAAKRIGAKTIRIIDDLEGPTDCDAIITQLPIDHSEIQAKLGIYTAWTGLDGFLVRPEFYAAQKKEVPIHYDFFIYVTTKAAFEFYSQNPLLRKKSVFAITSDTFSARCKKQGWPIGLNLSPENIALCMKRSSNAILPSSTIAIEFLIAKGQQPLVKALAANQEVAFTFFTERNLFLPAEKRLGSTIRKPDMTTSMPSDNLINWVHASI